MNPKRVDVAIVGAGQAGLGLSYFLQQAGRRHLVFERGRIGETWLTQRWDSFKLNTLNTMNTLPGMAYTGSEPDGFWTSAEFAGYLQRYVQHFALPIRTRTNVTSVEPGEIGADYLVKTMVDGSPESSVLCRAVVIASGVQHTPKYPALRSRMPAGITQLHTSEYQNAAALPPGAVVVIGSGQSGCQIVEDLLTAGRTVHLSTSQVGRVRRRYRGRDILAWMIETGFWDVTLASLNDKSLSLTPQPQISGLGRYGHTVSLQYLARQGALILGHVQDVEGDTLVLADDAAAHVRFADTVSKRFSDGYDAYLAQRGITPPPLEDDPADMPDPDAACVSSMRHLSLAEAGINTIIWATGFQTDFSWVHLPAFSTEGKPMHERGISPLPGLYFLGFPWLNSRKSGIIYGIKEDAGYIAAAVARQFG